MIDCNLQGTRSPSHQYESRRLGGFLLCPFQNLPAAPCRGCSDHCRCDKSLASKLILLPLKQGPTLVAPTQETECDPCPPGASLHCMHVCLPLADPIRTLDRC